MFERAWASQSLAHAVAQRAQHCDSEGDAANLRRGGARARLEYARAVSTAASHRSAITSTTSLQ
eukprot:scaffold200764_cov39-Tisochrysis_lutea.AAC.4